MKHVITVCVMLWTCAYSVMSRTLYESDIAKAHQQWVSQYGRSYVDEAEKEKRFTIFMENLKFIENFNSGENKSYKLGLNQYSDLTEQEFIASHTGLNISNLPRSSSRRRHKVLVDQELMGSDKGYMKLLRETGQLGGLCGLATRPSYPTF
ncbi:hypothetical protein VNO78_03900 [Psophocarpus tetragonolobus]|uniref:Cathepsin propeptide inhibitor domain-containing protein n=1 Tax=Psophocarpus tetragonolobus TaxID=3891 RepID=A0AAN9XXD1_PSOTE